jgi:excisionase family DNA binding protein
MKTLDIDNPHGLLTLKQASEYLTIPLPTVYYLAQRGQLPAIKIGGRWRIKAAALDAIINPQPQEGLAS